MRKLSFSAGLGFFVLVLSFIGCSTTKSNVEAEKTSGVYYKLGLAYLTENPPKLQKAYVEFFKAVEADPSNVDAHYAIGHVHAKREEYEKAIEAFQKVLVLNPGSSKAHNYLGNVYEIMGREEEAITAYRAALHNFQYETPQLPRWKLGHLYLRRQAYDLALSEFQEARRIEPENLLVIYQIGETYVKIGQIEKARAFFEEAVKIAPKDYKTHDRLATFYLEQGLSVQAAEESLKKVIELAPESLAAAEARRVLKEIKQY